MSFNIGDEVKLRPNTHYCIGPDALATFIIVNIESPCDDGYRNNVKYNNGSFLRPYDRRFRDEDLMLVKPNKVYRIGGNV